MEGRAVVWWTNLLHQCNRARQISTRELDPHLFPDEVDWTTRHAFSGAYDLPRRGCGLEKLLRHMNRGREARVGTPIESRLFFESLLVPPLRDVSPAATVICSRLWVPWRPINPKTRAVVAMIRCPEASPDTTLGRV